MLGFQPCARGKTGFEPDDGDDSGPYGASRNAENLKGIPSIRAMLPECRAFGRAVFLEEVAGNRLDLLLAKELADHRLRRLWGIDFTHAPTFIGRILPLRT